MKSNKCSPFFIGVLLSLFTIASYGCDSSKNEYGELTNEYGKLMELADKYKTDKGSIKHRYAEVYEFFLKPIKYKARKICEIGIAHGASLKAFQDYFPEATIYGIDWEDKSSLDSDTIKTFVADQADRKRLALFAKTYGGDYDIILDDGGHTMAQQQISFGYLFKLVKPGGYYVLEDLHTSLTRIYGSRFGAEENEKNTSLEMVYKFIRGGKIERHLAVLYDGGMKTKGWCE